jgi:hypothetical protein
VKKVSTFAFALVGGRQKHTFEKTQIRHSSQKSDGCAWKSQHLPYWIAEVVPPIMTNSDNIYWPVLLKPIVPLSRSNGIDL